MAITGPYIKSFLSGDGLVDWRRSWRRQTKPRTVRLPYSFYHKRVTKIHEGSLGGWGAYPVSQITTFSGSLSFPRAYSAALSKFSRGIEDTAELGNALAEKAQSVQMIISRVQQLTEFTKAIQRGRFGDAAMSLGLKFEPKFSQAQEKLWSKRQDKMFKWSKRPLKHPPKGARPEPTKAKGAADNWLEFWFGWSPLVADIYQALKNLEDGIPPITVRGVGSGSDSRIGYSDYGQGGTSAVTKCQIIADVRVINPMVHMLSQMGLTNPVGILWEVTKFSFVLDWFSNAGQFLKAWHGYPGVVLSNAAVTYTTVWKTEYRDYLPPGWVPRQLEGLIFTMDRTLFVGNPPHPKFVLTDFRRNHRFSKNGGESDFKGLSPTRGASAIALLVQRMRSLS